MAFVAGEVDRQRRRFPDVTGGAPAAGVEPIDEFEAERPRFLGGAGRQREAESDVDHRLARQPGLQRSQRAGELGDRPLGLVAAGWRGGHRSGSTSRPGLERRWPPGRADPSTAGSSASDGGRYGRGSRPARRPSPGSIRAGRRPVDAHRGRRRRAPPAAGGARDRRSRRRSPRRPARPTAPPTAHGWSRCAARERRSHCRRSALPGAPRRRTSASRRSAAAAQPDAAPAS